MVIYWFEDWLLNNTPYWNCPPDQCDFHYHSARWCFNILQIISRWSLLLHGHSCLTKVMIWSDIPHDPLHLGNHTCMHLDSQSACISLWCPFIILGHTRPQTEGFPFHDPHNRITQWLHTSHTCIQAHIPSQTHIHDYTVLLCFMTFPMTLDVLCLIMSWLFSKSLHRY